MKKEKLYEHALHKLLGRKAEREENKGKEAEKAEQKAIEEVADAIRALIVGCKGEALYLALKKIGWSEGEESENKYITIIRGLIDEEIEKRNAKEFNELFKKHQEMLRNMHFPD